MGGLVLIASFMAGKEDPQRTRDRIRANRFFAGSFMAGLTKVHSIHSLGNRAPESDRNPLTAGAVDDIV